MIFYAVDLYKQKCKHRFNVQHFIENSKKKCILLQILLDTIIVKYLILLV